MLNFDNRELLSISSWRVFQLDILSPTDEFWGAKSISVPVLLCCSLQLHIAIKSETSISFPKNFLIDTKIARFNWFLAGSENVYLRVFNRFHKSLRLDFHRVRNFDGYFFRKHSETLSVENGRSMLSDSFSVLARGIAFVLFPIVLGIMVMKVCHIFIPIGFS